MIIHNWGEAGWAETLRISPIVATERVPDMTPIDPKRIEILDPMVARILRTMTPAEKMQQMAAADRCARTILTHTIRQSHPQWNETQVATEVVRRIRHGSD